MKKFITENWYKWMIGSSLLMASFGFKVHSVSPACRSNSSNNSARNLLTPGEIYIRLVLEFRVAMFIW